MAQPPPTVRAPAPPPVDPLDGRPTLTIMVDDQPVIFEDGIDESVALRLAPEIAARRLADTAPEEQRRLLRQFATDFAATGGDPSGGGGREDFSQYVPLREKYIAAGLDPKLLPSPENAELRSVRAAIEGAAPRTLQAAARPVSSFAQGVGEGAALGGSDELSALATALQAPLVGESSGEFSTDYATQLERARGALAGADTVPRIAGNLAGFLGTAPIGAAVKGTELAVRGAQLAGRALERAPSALSALLRSPFTQTAGKAAAGGGTYAFNTGEGGFEERVSDVPVGAALGGATGGLLAGAGRLAASPVARRVASTGAGGAVGGAVGASVPGDNPLGAEIGAGTGALAGLAGPRASVRAVSNLLRRSPPNRNETIASLVESAGLGAPEAQAILGRLERSGGEPVSLADVGPQSLRQLAFASAARPSEAGNRALQALEERAAGEGTRVLDAARRGLVKGEAPADVVAGREALIAAREERASPLYQQAFAEAPLVESPELAAILRRPDALDVGVRRAVRDAANRGEELPGFGYKLNKAGEPTRQLVVDPNNTGVFDSRAVHEVAVALRKEADDLAASGKGTQAAGLYQLREDILGELEAVSGPYRAARTEYARLSAPVSAFEEASGLTAKGTGRAFDSIDPAVLKSRFEKLSPEAQDAYRQGAYLRLQSLAAETGDQAGSVASTLRKVAGTPEDRARLQVLFGSPEEFANFQNRVDLENAYRTTNQAVRQGSQTAGRQVAQETLDDVAVGGALPSIATGGVGNVLGSALRSTVGRNVERQRAARSEQIADFLLSPVGEEQRAVLANLLRQGAPRAADDALASVIPEVAGEAPIAAAVRSPVLRGGRPVAVSPEESAATLSSLLRGGGRAAASLLSPLNRGAYLAGAGGAALGGREY